LDIELVVSWTDMLILDDLLSIMFDISDQFKEVFRLIYACDYVIS